MGRSWNILPRVLLVAGAWMAAMEGVFAAETASSYPARPIKVIVPFAAGGGSDTFVRIMQKAIEDNGLLPQPLVVINIPGAGGTIGSRRVLNAAPDGYTILNLHQGILTAKYSGKVNYGPEAFEPIAATGEDLMILAVGGDSRFQGLEELLDAAEAAPETIAYGANLGAPSHFSGLLLENAHPGARFRFVQTGGGARRFGELQGGHIVLTTFSVSEFLRFRSGGIRALAFLGAERHPALPEVPAAREQGFDVTTSNMQFWWAPKGTRPERIQVLAEVFERAMKTDYVRGKLDELEIAPVFHRGGELRQVIGEREEAIARVDTRPSIELPNLPAMVFGVVVLLSLGVLGQSMLGGRFNVGSVVKATGQGTSRPSPGWLAACGAIVFGYAGVLSLQGLNFIAATVAFVFLLALSLERMLRASTGGNRGGTSLAWRDLLQIAGLALVVGAGCQILFTRVFVIDLP